MSSDFHAWLATRTGGQGVVPAFARAVCAGEVWRLRADSAFHDDVSRAARNPALAEWSRSRSTKSNGSGQTRPATARGRRLLSIRSSSSVKRRVRMQVRATPGQGKGTGQAVVSTFNLEYRIGFGFSEQVLPGAFADSIAAHPTIPIFYNHDWAGAPIGSGRPKEQGNQLLVDFRLYLGQSDLVDRVYQAMIDEALEEWSIGFWAETITTTNENPKCDQIAQGDLAEASVCVRGANPVTGTLELAGKTGWLMGNEREQKAEVDRIRAATKRLVRAR